MRLGMGYRRPLAAWIDTHPPELQCLEVTAEHFFEGDSQLLQRLREHYPLMVHGLGLSLGTPGPLDRDVLDRFVDVCKAADPLWVSEHVAFTSTREVDLGHLNPVRSDLGTLRVVADHAREVSERCGKPILLENITSHLRLGGSLTETEFLNRLCEEADCGLLLDVTNLMVNSRNHGFSSVSWLRDIDPNCIRQLHVVGYTRSNGRWEDLHAEAIQMELFELVQEVIDYASVQAVIVERDRNFPAPAALEEELRALGRACGGN